ncbi:hypothetical protein [Alkaliphilus sp. B6464]|uniref:hypothetical protein n=1 Tax=Alkaliphilus sp. B6464 TaxID=2731219 RepID=UPI001BABDE37|nr:hypothetical protein [Alkaliphilus sp. B6464]QUH21776.1 hypothetical protein HYG84_17725 [Alkaliphilus sp. B6464]
MLTAILIIGIINLIIGVILILWTNRIDDSLLETRIDMQMLKKDILKNIENLTDKIETLDINNVEESAIKEWEQSAAEEIDFITEDASIKTEDIANLTIKEMYQISKFVVEQEEDEKWYVYKAMCQLDGCNMEGTPFETEREALEEGVKMTLEGKKLSMYACPSCYIEYQNEFVL